jgi:membrane-associated phospholipid phosphatase
MANDEAAPASAPLAPAADPVVRQARWGRTPHPAIVAALVIAAYAGYCWKVGGVRLDRSVIMPGCGIIALAAARTRPQGRFRTLLIDWAPVFLVLVAWDYTRGLADSWFHTSYYFQPRADRFLTGRLPTVWLQRHLYPHGHVLHWWDVFPSAVYFSHAVVSSVVLAVLWSRSRAHFQFYAWRLVAVTLIGLVVFILHPAAPPWIDSSHHVIPHIDRTSAAAFQVVHFRVAAQLFYGGARTVNTVAAFPSLHAAYSVLPLLYFWRRVSKWWRPVLVLYPLAMGFSLILMGEHWLVDVFAGYLLSAVVWLVMPLLERWARRWLNSHWRRVPEGTAA